MVKVKFLKNHLNHQKGDISIVDQGIAKYLLRMDVVRVELDNNPNPDKKTVKRKTTRRKSK